MAKNWVPKKNDADAARVTRLLAEEKAAAEAAAAKEAAADAKRARQANPRCRADRKVLRG